MEKRFGDKPREAQLKEIIRRIHQGEQVSDLRHEFRYLLEHLSAEEIAEMEQALIHEGFPAESIQELCEIHVDVFEEALQKNIEQQQHSSHPVTVFKQENQELEKRLKAVKRLIRQGKGDFTPSLPQKLKEAAADLRSFEKHYVRKENQLFPRLEAAGFTGSASVMWGKHDEIRELLKEFISGSERQAPLKELKAKFSALSKKMEKMIFMEEKILYPASMKKLTDQDWQQIRMEEQEIGLAWLEPSAREDPPQHSSQLPPQAEPLYNDKEEEMMNKPIQIPLNEGFLTQQQLDLMLRHLPVDLTFVDEHDQVRYYSATDERVFPRTPSIIGRDVKNCHPPKSVHMVEKIVQAFKDKERSSAEFWIDFEGRKIHIRYFALYDAGGNYRGTVEVSQDITEIQKLEGQKQLLDWE